ncbi:DUF4374 domain-containing protein [Reichenbachiella ulvae]|uniref:DUF4374 domain-containing protein n=1 Tax=Reichenbachiella ulvae TaxID=2980104 RepID=A0ABT3CRL6_9BACT|nr:DUF4374 domain-containing protein [Reichenbachiella ulvae]MCV9386130.1 DUF4374 domain-containing protein [Reichenbachiella ulvae]
MKKQLLQIIVGVIAAGLTFTSCIEDDGGSINSAFFVGVEAESGTDVIVGVDDLSTGVISPIGTGVEQPAWMSFYQMGNTMLACGYTSDNLTTGYRMVDTVFTEVGSLVTELGIYGMTEVDDKTAIAVGVTRSGFEPRVFYFIDLESMSITRKVSSKIDERQEEGLVAWPTGMVVQGNKFFVSYYLMGAGELEDVPAFATPNSNQARVAVYSYPELEFEKIITDDRTTDIGVYSGERAILETEGGDLYTYSTSALANGFLPTPDNPSGFLRIISGSTEFDSDYFFNFEEKSGGYKLNNVVYAGNGKAVVRMAKEDDTNPDYKWATYGPNIEAELAICEMAIVDLENQSITKLDIPAHGGEWGMANLVYDGKVYVNVSTADEAHIYEIDPQTATAVKGAKINGNWAKGFAVLKD